MTSENDQNSSGTTSVASVTLSLQAQLQPHAKV